MLCTQRDILQVYDYIRICLLYHQRGFLKSAFNLTDLQHDIFIYLHEKRKVLILNPQTKRYIFILARYYPIYLKNYRYSRKQEQVLTTPEGELVDIGLSYFPSGDITYDLQVYTKPTNKGRKVAYTARQVRLTYYDQRTEVCPSIEQARERLEINRSTINKWLSKGIPNNRRSAKDIIKLEYL